MNYENMTREELINYINNLNEELNGKYGLVWDKEKEPEKIVVDCDKYIPIINEEVDKNIGIAGNNNILIQGDNFHSLSVLNYTHKGSIDIIYIDPPYNTGNKDFIYNDNYVNEDDGYRHSKWLNFMEKRLKIAKKILKEDGAIFISIDEHEFAQLKLLCDKIFNYKNYVGEFVRKTKSSTNDADSFFNQQHDYCLIYKNKDFSFAGVQKDLDGYKNPDNDPHGNWKSSDPSAKSGGESTYFEIKNPITGQVDFPPKGRYWAFSKKTFEEYIKNGKIKFKDAVKNGERGFIFKSYQKQLKNLNKPIDSLIFDDNKYMNQVATKELNKLNIDFNYPKPVDFIKDIIKSVGNDSAIILDFFAGTGTTGEAVLKLNEEDGGNRRFILCTNNENGICDNATYKRMKSIFNCDKKTTYGNLKYFKTEFIKNTGTRDQLYYDLTEKCIPMLCVKSDTYELVEKNKEYVIYSNKDKTEYSCVYFDIFGESYGKFIDKIKGIKEHKNLYIFSLSEYVNEENFEGITNYDIEPIPYKILDLYKNIVKMSKEN